MIVVKIMGGLGNQMFQYSTALRLARHHNTNLTLDTSWFGNQSSKDTPRAFELSQCKVTEPQTSSQVQLASSPNRVLRKMQRSFLGRPLPYHEQGFRFQPAVLSLPKQTMLTGYFQSEQYFQDIRAELLKTFTPSYKINPILSAVLKDIKKTDRTVSLHVRRGDYVTNKHAQKFHGLTGIKYYKAALKVIESKVKGKLTVYVFSDDLSWCRKNLAFPKHRIVFVDGAQKSFDDMWLMSHCQHQIIANSSFSWWGAWLNKNPNKTVVAPKQWFLDTDVDTTDLVPKDWVRL